MSYRNPLQFLPPGVAEFFHTLAPDFVLGFTFFTALTYAVLGRRFGEDRPAVAMSAALGLALSLALVWWEAANGYSIRDLSAIAVGLTILVLAGVVYQAVRGVGGTWSGASIALAAAMLIGSVLGIDWPGGSGMLALIGFIAATVGITTFFYHRRTEYGRPASESGEVITLRRDLADLKTDRSIGEQIRSRLHLMDRDADTLHDRPEVGDQLLAQLDQVLPAEGWLTDRMAQLREKMVLAERGHFGRIHELRERMRLLTGADRQHVVEELQARLRELRLDQRVERLDRSVAQTERRIVDLTRRARALMQRREYNAIPDLIESADKLQSHSDKLLAAIVRTEQHLLHEAEEAAEAASRMGR